MAADHLAVLVLARTACRTFVSKVWIGTCTARIHGFLSLYVPIMRSVAHDYGRRGCAACSLCSCRMAACPRKLGCASEVRQQRATRSQAATIEIADVPAPPIDAIPCYSPKALQLESGELSQVVRDPSDAPEDIFRCVGCTDAACQVLLFQADCSIAVS